MTSTSTPVRPDATARPRRTGGIARILAASVLWGTTGTVSSLAPAGASPVAVGCAGTAVGGLLLLCTGRGARALLRRTAGRDRLLLLLGALAVAVYPATFYPAVARTGVAVATVLALGSAPVFTGLLGWAGGHGRPGARWTAATAAAVAGCTGLVLGPELSGGTVQLDAGGVGLALLAGLGYAVYAFVGGRLISGGAESDAALGAMFGVAAVPLAAVAVLCGGPALLGLRGAAVVAHLAVLTTFVAYRLFGGGLRAVGAQAATTLTLAEPAVATLLGVAALGERLPAASWTGLVLLGVGLALLALPARRSSAR